MKLVRWVPTRFADQALTTGLISHNGSAMWVFDLDQTYRPGAAISRDAWLIVYDMDETATLNVQNTDLQIDFESDQFRGEGKHQMHVIVKSNETGAYGIGYKRQLITDLHTKTRYATKKEVAKALGLTEREVDDQKYKPTGGWPRG